MVVAVKFPVVLSAKRVEARNVNSFVAFLRSQAQYQESMESARDEKEKRMPDMVRDLDTNIARLNDQLVQLGASLDEGVFVDAACFGNPGLVLTELDRVKQRLAAVDTLAKQYSAFQALFGITVYR